MHAAAGAWVEARKTTTMKRDPHQNVRLAVQRNGDPGAAHGRPSGDAEPPNVAWLEQRRLVHELEVHQLELEIQNRALRENQELLEESRARYATLYDYAPVGHVALDRQGLIRELNLTCAALLGEDRRLLAGRPFRLLLAPASRRHFDDHLRLCFAGRQPSSVELAIPVGHGDVLDVRIVELVSAAHAAPDTGTIDPVVIQSALHDITERKRDERRREEIIHREHEARLLAERANRIKEEFLDVVSHELRTPLAPMMMWVRALRAGGAGDNLRARAIEAIETCLELQSSMIDDLVDAARGRRGTLRVERRPMDLQTVVGAAVEALAPSCAAKHVALDLGLEAAPAWVSGDATRLQQVVANLMSNAIKFTREGGHISVSVQTRNAEVVLRVRDDGEGIDVTRLDGIFEPFRPSVGETPSRRSGLGLGLSIVHQLVSQHDGHVEAESPGRGLGACFTVTLPRAAETGPLDALS
jgi:PAS domain S-box-containing protein